MALLKHTTEIEASRSIGEIMGILTEMGAEEITVTYTGQQRTPSGLQFAVETVHGRRSFRLPSRIDAVLETLRAEHAATKQRTKQGAPTRERAVNVAWRILRAWAEAQLALVQIGMATTDEIMLPYMLVGHGLTVYEDYDAKQRALPSGDAG